MADGFIREYIVRVIDETSGNDMVPQSAKMAEVANTGGVAGIKRSSGANAAKTAKSTNTKVFFNAGLQVGMPLFNALTNGVAGKVMAPVRNVIQLGTAIATGASVGGLVGAGAGLAGWAVSELVNFVTNETEKNKAEADRLNNRDNLLIRSGSKSYATFYSGGLFGVKNTDRK